MHNQQSVLHYIFRFVGMGLEDSIFEYVREDLAVLEEDYKFCQEE